MWGEYEELYLGVRWFWNLQLRHFLRGSRLVYDATDDLSGISEGLLVYDMVCALLGTFSLVWVRKQRARMLLTAAYAGAALGMPLRLCISLLRKEAQSHP